jgi:outer membrane receptor protein involved in Fe transport
VPANPDARVTQTLDENRLLFNSPIGRMTTIQSSFYLSKQVYATKPTEFSVPDFEQHNRIAGNDTRLFFADGTTLGGSYERDDQNNLDQSENHIVNVAGYIEKDFHWQRLSFIPAARLDDNSAFGSIVNPRLTAVYHLTDILSLSGNLARAYRAPSFLELFYQSPTFNGNPDLSPEKGWTTDLGAAFRLEHETIQATYFRSQIKDRIAPTLTTYENQPDAFIHGLEFGWTGNVPLFQELRLTHDVSTTRTWAYGNSASNPAEVPLRMTPVNTAGAQVGLIYRVWTLSNNFRYKGEVWEQDNHQGGRLPPFFVWDANLTRSMKHLDLTVGVRNILNRRYAESFDMDLNTFQTTIDPQPDRNYWARATFHFSS